MVQLTLDASMIPDRSGARPVVTLRGVTPAITMHGVGGDAGDAPGGYVYRALVPPGAIAGGVRMFRVELDGRVFVSEPLAGSLELSGGRVETFGLSLVLDDYDYSSEISDQGFDSYFHIYLDSNDDGQLSYDEIMAITEIGVMEWEIESMEGIRDFKNLVKLDCGINYIRELDLTGLTKLETLWCSYNELEELDVTGLPALKELRCDGNLITRLDLSANSAIESVWCGNVGSPEMVVVVDPDLDLSSVSVFALDALGGGLTRITEREVAVNGVTVVNKQ